MIYYNDNNDDNCSTVHKMHTGTDLVNDANLLQEEKGHDDYDFNDDDVENGNDDEGRFRQNAYWGRSC